MKVLSLSVGNVSKKKTTGLLSLGDSLDIFLLWLQKVLHNDFTTVLTRKQQNCRDSNPLNKLISDLNLTVHSITIKGTGL